MQLNYTITQEHYEDVIAFQLKLQRSKRRSLIQYIVTNAIFIILAVYFLVTGYPYKRDVPHILLDTKPLSHLPDMEFL